MAYPYNPTGDKGVYVVIPPNFDVQTIAEMQPGSEQDKDFMIKLVATLNNMANVINLKETGLCIEQEVNNGVKYFGTASPLPQSWRNEFTYVVNIGSLGAGVTTKAHGLGVAGTGIAGLGFTFTRIDITASNPSTALIPGACHNVSIPWVGAGGLFITSDITDLNIVINNQSGLTFSSCIATLKYLKQ